MAKNAAAGRLHSTTDLPGAVRQALAIFIAMGTPPEEDRSADLSYVVEDPGDTPLRLLRGRLVTR